METIQPTEETKQEKAYLLQKLDCNCNECGFLKRDLEKYNQTIKEDKETQLYLFEFNKRRRLEEALSQPTPEKVESALKVIQALKHQYNGQRNPVLYGNCTKLNKEITFIPGLLQLDTQLCFEHRLDLLSEDERNKKLGKVRFNNNNFEL